VWGQHSFALIDSALDAKHSEGKRIPACSLPATFNPSKLDNPAADCKLRLSTLE
jgi:hypothetical protein